MSQKRWGNGRIAIGLSTTCEQLMKRHCILGTWFSSSKSSVHGTFTRTLPKPTVQCGQPTWCRWHADSSRHRSIISTDAGTLHQQLGVLHGFWRLGFSENKMRLTHISTACPVCTHIPFGLAPTHTLYYMYILYVHFFLLVVFNMKKRAHHWFFTKDKLSIFFPSNNTQNSFS